MYAGSQWPLAQDNPYPRETYFGMAYSDSLHMFIAGFDPHQLQFFESVQCLKNYPKNPMSAQANTV